MDLGEDGSSGLAYFNFVYHYHYSIQTVLPKPWQVEFPQVGKGLLCTWA